jgi:acyl-CoA thioesterase FadM
VLDWRRARSLRQYEVRRAGGDDAPVAGATTDWVYCDMASGRPMSVPEDMRRAFSGSELTTLPRARALPEAGAGAPVTMSLVVRPSLLDHVTHVNNAAYSAMLEDGAFELFAARGWPLARMLEHGGALRIRRIDLEYLDDALAGDRLVVHSWLVAREVPDAPAPRLDPDAPPGDARLLQTIAREDGSRILRAASEWVWRRRPAVLGGVPDA